MTIKLSIQTQVSQLDISSIIALKDEREQQGMTYKLDLSLFKVATEKVNHILCWEGQELLGYGALCNFDLTELEITIVTKPDLTIIQSVIETCFSFAKERKIERILLIIDRNDRFTKSYVIETNSYDYCFSEYGMFLSAKKFKSIQPELYLEPAGMNDGSVIASLENSEIVEEQNPIDPEDLKNTLVYKQNKEIIASIRIDCDQDRYGIYGFVIRADYRGQGIGRKILSQVIEQLLEKQAKEIYLEVESTNTAAFHLYQAIGFEEKSLFDYYLYNAKNKQ